MNPLPSIVILLLLAIAGFYVAQAQALEVRVASQREYREAVKHLQPGDTIVLANGEWEDFEVLFVGAGKAGQPITLTAETKGRVLLTGRSNLRLAGAHLVVSGLVFTRGYSPTGTVIAFRRNKRELANHSRVTEVVIDHYNNPERYETDVWVMMYGRHNRFDHNHLEGKNNAGVTLAVRLDSEESRQNRHRIDHNYFGPRPVLGSNGGETLRIGTSRYSMNDSLTLVENNYFDRCNGEVEIISNKSGGNVFRGNLFYESRGTLTLRHGNGNLVEGNVFIGNHVAHTGGIRVINKRQTIRNNYLYGLTGHRFGGALVVMNGVPNSPLNRYHQVEDTIIENNSIIASDHIELAAGSDEERTATPRSSSFRNNLIYREDGMDPIAVHDDVNGITFSGNLTNVINAAAIATGFDRVAFPLVKADNGLWYPGGALSARVVGASRNLKVLKKASTGVSSYPKPGPKARFDSGNTVSIHPGENALSNAISAAGAGDVIELAEGQYQVARTLVIDRPLTVRNAPARGRASIAFERTALFELADGGSLKLIGVKVTGASAPDVAGNAVIRTSRYSMLNNYALIIEDSTIVDLDTNHSFDFFTSAKSTFADRITISRSTFRNITGSVLSMNREIENLGIYNGEYIVISESAFSNVQGAVAAIYRGGTDESTFGPHFEMTRAKVDSVGQGRRNASRASVSLHGVQSITIRDNTWSDSQPIVIVETVGGPTTTIVGNEFHSTPAPQIRSVETL